MKPYNYLLLSILLYPLFTSCTKEEETSDPVSLTPRIAGISVTRAGINDAKDIQAIGFYAVAVSKDPSDVTYGTWPTGTYGKYTSQTSGSNTTFTPAADGDILWLVPQKDATIFSCHPVPALGKTDIVDASTLNQDGTAKNSVTTPSDPIPVIPVPESVINLSPSLPADGNTDFTFPKNDYMYGVIYDNSNPTEEESNKYKSTQPIANGNRTGGIVNQSGPAVSIGLKHAFSQVRLIIKKGDSYPGTATVGEVKYTRAMSALTANTKMKLTDGTFLGITDPAEISYTFDLKSSVNNTEGKEVPSAEGQDLTINSYALPCPASKSTISLSVDGKTMSIDYTDDPLWQAGKIYTYAVTINGTGLAFSGVSVVSWNDSNDNNSSGTL